MGLTIDSNVKEYLERNNYAIHLITKWEGCELSSYKDSAGIWTVGYGHIQGVAEGLTICPLQAYIWVVKELESYGNAVRNTFAGVDLTNYEFGALVSLSYNVGNEAVAKSELAKKIIYDKTMYKDISKEWLEFCNAGGKYVNGLEKRRINEVDCYTNGNLWDLGADFIMRDKANKVISRMNYKS